MAEADIITGKLASSGRLDKALADATELSRERIKGLIAAGAVTIGKTLARSASAKVQGEERFAIALPPPEPLAALPQDIPLDIVFEDAHLLVVDKPAGMVVHPAAGNQDGTLVNALLHHCAGRLSGINGIARPGIVHRIDKDTSGLLVVAKSDRAHHGLAAQFEAHTAQRRYLALAHGVIDAADPRLRGTPGLTFEDGGVLKIASRLARHATDRQRQAVWFDKGRHAVTRARMIESFGRPPSAMLVECRLETGRTHQIRVHMSHAGLGLIGDPVYGGARRASIRSLGEAAAEVQAFPRQALHAAHLGFDHPVSQQALAFDSPLPQDMQRLLDRLRGAPS